METLTTYGSSLVAGLLALYPALACLKWVEDLLKPSETVSFLLHLTVFIPVLFVIWFVLFALMLIGVHLCQKKI